MQKEKTILVIYLSRLKGTVKKSQSSEDKDVVREHVIPFYLTGGVDVKTRTSVTNKEHIYMSCEINVYYTVCNKKISRP